MKGEDVWRERDWVDCEQVSAMRVHACGISFVGSGAEMLNAGGGGLRSSLDKKPDC